MNGAVVTVGHPKHGGTISLAAVSVALPLYIGGGGVGGGVGVGGGGMGGAIDDGSVHSDRRVISKRNWCGCIHLL